MAWSSWVESFWKQEEKVVEEEKVVKKKYSKNAELASEAGRNAREAVCLSVCAHPKQV
jgi:hypothetical protein